MGKKSLSSGLGSQLLGGLLGGGDAKQQQQGGGLAGILSGVLGSGGQQPSGSGGALGGLLGSVLGGGSGTGTGASGISGLLGSVMGGGGAQQATATPPIEPKQQAAANEEAILMIRAMVNAAKSDGRIDATEQEKIISKLGDDVSQAEADFLRKEFAAPLNVAEFSRSIPRGMEPQIYAISLTSIDLDTQNEAQYLGKLAQGMNLDPKLCNQIHDQLGAPKIFK